MHSLVSMASENSNGSEAVWMPLPSLPRISVASSSRARLAHRRPTSISLPVQVRPSSSSQSGGEKLENLKTFRGQLSSRDSLDNHSAPPLVSSLSPAAANRFSAADSDCGLAPICEQARSSPTLSSAPLSLPELIDIASVSSVSDDSVRISGPSASSGPFPCDSPGSAKPCDDSGDVSNINPRLTSLEAVPQPSMPLVDADSRRQQGKSEKEFELITLTDDGETQKSSESRERKLLCTDGAEFCEDNSSLAQSPRLQVKVAELNNNLGLDSEESEPEEGQIPGEWSGIDDSVEESDQISDENSEDCRTPPFVNEDGLTVAQITKLTGVQFRLGNKSSLPRCSTLHATRRSSRESETVEKKRKKHKKGEGAKKRSREKSAQKYKEKKKQRLKANAVESPVARLRKGEQPESQSAKRKSVEIVNQVPKSQEKRNSREDVVEEGEITQPTQPSAGLLSSLVEAEIGLWTTDDIDDQLVAQMEQDVAVKKKRGPETAERMLKRKIAKRKKRAKKEKELGVRKRNPRNNVSKPPVKALCTHFMKGRCAKGENCPFSHDAVPLTKQEPCKFFMSHSCLKGDNCPFSHELKAFPCKFFHTRGLCYDGDKCLFSHGPITEEEREKLLRRVEKDKERGSNPSVFEVPTPDFSSHLPAEEDPDPFGWGTVNTHTAFDVDVQQRSPEAMDVAPKYSIEAEFGNILETSYREDSNGEIAYSSKVDVAGDVQLHNAYSHSSNENTSEKLDHMDMQCRKLQPTTGPAISPDTLKGNITSSATEISAVSFAARILPTQRGSLFVKTLLEPKKSVPSLTQTTGSRKRTVDSLLGEVLKH